MGGDPGRTQYLGIMPSNGVTVAFMSRVSISHGRLHGSVRYATVVVDDHEIIPIQAVYILWPSGLQELLVGRGA